MTTTIETLTNAVMTSTNLDALLENLNALADACREDENGLRPDEACDMSSLPAFTSETDIPENDGAGGAYSWDATRRLTLDANGGWIIVDRG